MLLMVSYRPEVLYKQAKVALYSFITESCFPEAYCHHKCPMGLNDSSMIFYKFTVHETALCCFFRNKIIAQLWHCLEIIIT